MAVYGMGVVVAPIIGPTLGGWITDNYSWRWIFYINAPVGVLAVLMVQTFVTGPPYLRRVRAGRIDYAGFALLALWVGALQIVLDKGQEVDWFAAPWLRVLAAISSLRSSASSFASYAPTSRSFACASSPIAISRWGSASSRSSVACSTPRSRCCPSSCRPS